jgi:hypothetical protein
VVVDRNPEYADLVCQTNKIDEGLSSLEHGKTVFLLNLAMFSLSGRCREQTAPVQLGL